MWIFSLEWDGQCVVDGESGDEKIADDDDDDDDDERMTGRHC